MHEFLIYAISGLTTAGIYAITASGLTLTYVTTGVFNFAHGATGAFAAFAYWQMRFAWNWPAPIAILVTLGILAPGLGLLLERYIMRRLEGTSDATKLVVTVAVLVATVGIIQTIWDPTAFRTTHELFGNKFTVANIDIPYNDVTVLVLALLVAIGLRLLLYRTRLGIAMRATVDDRSLAVMNGARPNRASQASWIIGTQLAALAGILVAPKLNLSALPLTLLIVNAYAASMIGRLRSLPMTFVGALILGLANDLVVGYLPKIKTGQQYVSGLGAVTPVFVLLLAVLLLKQTKLRGTSTQRTREISPTPTWGGSLIFVGIIVVMAIAATPIISAGDLFASTKMWGIGIIALSLIPLVGYAGRISLCQLSFAGIGAVVVAHAGANGAPASLLLAAVVAAIAGAIISLPALRLSGIYLALLTAAFAVTLDNWVFQLPAFNNFGHKKFDLFESGSLSFNPFSIGSLSVKSPKTYFVFGAVMFALMALVVVAIRRSQFGQRLLALKESPAACETLGMNPRMTTLAVFTLSAAMAGFGGGIYGAALQTATPDTFQFFNGLAILLVVVIGGVSSIGSAFFAAVFLGMPITTNIFNGQRLTQASSILTGFGAIGLGNNPNGFIAADLRTRFACVTKYPWLIGGGVGLCGLLYLLRTNDAVGGWTLVVGGMVILLALPGIAEQMDKRKAAKTAPPKTVSDDGTTVPLEWLGIDAPLTEQDVLVLDQTLHLPEVSNVSA
ncbi:MAG TPA: ABC transporter permease [Frankiaceae bacterium]|jgi:branched-chain amino acid transport system permease protein|nr:ABC transporter permease [Frankiaceae bacterium]